MFVLSLCYAVEVRTEKFLWWWCFLEILACELGVGRGLSGPSIRGRAIELVDVGANWQRVEFGMWYGGEDLRVRSTEMAADDSEG